jgi:short-subunit dehydrogenase
VASETVFRGVGALVTGASSGIGVAIARRLAGTGARLVLTARRGDRLAATAEECRALGAPDVHVVEGDLGDRSFPPRLAERATAALHAVDMLVNNAGFAVPGLSERASIERVTAMIEVNVTSHVTLTRLLLPGMLERRRGWILSVSSMAGILPAPYQAAYAGTKAFLLNWTESLREEVKDRGVVASAVCPGITDTEFFEAAGYRGANKFTSRKMPAEKVARVALAALACGKPRAVPGALNKALVFAGTRLSPRRLVQVVAKKLMMRRPIPVREGKGS